jgi:hypothetical protein
VTWWQQSPEMSEIFTAEDQELYIPIFMNLLPILLAYVEYYCDTISTEITWTQVLWPLSVPLPVLYMVWNYVTQTFIYQAKNITIIPTFRWEEFDNSFMGGVVFIFLQIFIYMSVTAIGRQKISLELQYFTLK